MRQYTEVFEDMGIALDVKYDYHGGWWFRFTDEGTKIPSGSESLAVAREQARRAFYGRLTPWERVKKAIQELPVTVP